MVYSSIMSKTRLHLLWSVLFLLSSIALWSKVTPFEAPPAVTEVVTVAAPQVEGIWEQYAFNGCQREFMARLEIRTRGEDYVAHPLSLAPYVYPQHSYRSFDHQKQGDTWTFKEDWDHGNIGQFTLKLQPNGEYWGVAESLQDGSRFSTIFVRVAD